MITIKRNTRFLLDLEKSKPDARLRFRVRWSDCTVAFNVGYRINPEKWSADTQRCKLSTTHGSRKVQANVINRELQKFEDACMAVFTEFERLEIVPDSSRFRESFAGALGKKKRSSSGVKKVTFDSIYDGFVASQGSLNTWTRSTYYKFSTLKGHLLAFNPDLQMSDFTDSMLERFVQFLHSRNMRNTTISKNVAFLKWFLRWSHKNGLYSGSQHDAFRVKLKGTDGNSKEVIYLSWQELMGLVDFQFDPENERLERVRDVFCFCCFTGLRYSDVAKLTRSDVRDSYISLVTQKTDESLKIDLNRYSKSILEKYAGFSFPGDLALPVISNVKMNAYLKELGVLAGLDAPQRIVYFRGAVRYEEVHPKWALLTTHCGRRSFIVNAMFLGIPAEVIMRWTGHADFKAMKPYMAIVDELKSSEMEKFNR